MFVEDATECPIVTQVSLLIAGILREYVKKSGLPVYDRMTHSG